MSREIELLPCDCGGIVNHFIEDYESSIIVCEKCDKKWDIEQLWNAAKAPRTISADKLKEIHYEFSKAFMEESSNKHSLGEKMDICEMSGLKAALATLGITVREE